MKAVIETIWPVNASLGFLNKLGTETLTPQKYLLVQDCEQTKRRLKALWSKVSGAYFSSLRRAAQACASALCLSIAGVTVTLAATTLGPQQQSTSSCPGPKSKLIDLRPAF